MRKILFLNFGHHTMTPISAPEDVYLRRLPVRITLNDPSDGNEVYIKARDAVLKISGHLRDAVRDDEEIIVALPGASMIATAVVIAISAVLKYNPIVVTGTKISGGYVYSLNEDRLVDLEDLWNDVRGD